MFRLGAGRKPFDQEEALASGATISRFEHAARRCDVICLISEFVGCMKTEAEASGSCGICARVACITTLTASESTKDRLTGLFRSSFSVGRLQRW